MISFVLKGGPAIGPCCYDLHGEVAGDWTRFAPGRIARRDGKSFLDLPGAIADQLAAAGVRDAEVWDACTRCRPDWFFSHRRDGASCGRTGAVIWRRD